MRYSSVFYAIALASSVSASPAPIPDKVIEARAGGSTGTTLDAGAIQTGSFVDGSTSIGAEAGQAKSLTSRNNFINNCVGKPLTNGLQITSGSCNGISTFPTNLPKSDLN